MEPRPTEDFEPSINVKNLWTYTRKSSFNAAGVKLPGLFTTKGFDIDSAAFVAVIFLEFWGLYSIVSSIGVFNVEGSFNVLGFAVIFALFLIDVSLALLRHLPAGPDCRYKNSDVLASTPHERERLRGERGSRRFLKPICSLLILAVAGVKIYGFYMLNGGEITGLTVSVLVSYVFAALLHINNTGYFLSGLIFNRKTRKEYSKWARGSDDAHEVTIYGWRPFPLEIPNGEKIAIKEARAGKHEIAKETEENDESSYTLKTWGVLTDGQLQQLILYQPTPSAKTTVARAGLQAQLHILDAPPLTKDELAQRPRGVEPGTEPHTARVTQIYPDPTARGRGN
jgi:hypothetical protein